MYCNKVKQELSVCKCQHFIRWPNSERIPFAFSGIIQLSSAIFAFVILLKRKRKKKKIPHQERYKKQNKRIMSGE